MSWVTLTTDNMETFCKCPICERGKGEPWPPAKDMTNFELTEAIRNAAKYHDDVELAQIISEAIGTRAVGVATEIRDKFIYNYTNKITQR